jgi:hypothetical protein
MNGDGIHWLSIFQSRMYIMYITKPHNLFAIFTIERFGSHRHLQQRGWLSHILVKTGSFLSHLLQVSTVLLVLCECGD